MKQDIINSLIEKFVMLKTNSDYRVYDLVTRYGARWRESKHEIKTNPIYSDTILFKYFKRRGKRGSLYIDLLLNTIIEHRDEKKYKIPNEDELVFHLRLGDHAYHNNFLSKDYVGLIKNIVKDNNIRKITFVGAFAYQVWSEDTMNIKPKDCPTWEYTDEIQQRNINGLKRVFGDILDNFDLPIEIYSNLDIDKDICYCVSAKHFICDVGNLGGLMKKLGSLNQENIK
jgi:hypothetical protein